MTYLVPKISKGGRKRMKSSQARKLLLCSLLILSVVPVLFSTLPNFQAKATLAGPGNGNPRNGGHGGSGGPQDPQPHGGNINPYPNTNWNSTTTTSM